MALESCKVYILSCLEYLAIRDTQLNKKTWGQSNWGNVPYYWLMPLQRSLEQDPTNSDIDLMPINLVMFNNETETEE